MQKVSIKKLEQSVDVDFEALPDVSRNFIINYGLKQVLNDAHSSCVWKAKDGSLPYVEESDGDTSKASNSWKAAVLAAVQVKIAALESGDISTRKAAVPDRPETAVIVDWLSYDKNVTKKAVRAAIKEHGLQMFLEAYGEDKVAKEVKARAKRIELDDTTNDALDLLMAA